MRQFTRVAMTSAQVFAWQLILFGQERYAIDWLALLILYRPPHLNVLDMIADMSSRPM